MEKTPIPASLERVEEKLRAEAGLGSSFDLIARPLTAGNRQLLFFYVNGFVKDEVMTEIMTRLSYVEKGELARDAVERLLTVYVPHMQVEATDDFKQAVEFVYGGGSAIFVEGETTALLADIKTMPIRGVEEPDLERVVRGARDGFVELMLTNVTLLRRRIRDPKLCLEVTRIGKRSETDVCLAYIRDIVDDSLVQSIRDKLAKVDKTIDGLTLADKQLEELIIGKGWNPYPLVRYSERPDVVATHLMEGHVVLFVDTSPSVMILPTTFFHLLQHAEEYRQTPFIGSYMRWVRYVGVLASIFLLPLWFLLVINPDLKPEGMEFLGPEKKAHLPLLLQFFLAEIGIDLMRLAAVHTPTPLATAMGLVAAILIGDVAVQTGFFVNEVIMYIAVAAVGMFATPSYELSMANRITRLVLLALTAVFKISGLVAGTTAVMLVLIIQRSYNTPYMWPFIPFNAKALGTMLIRRPFGAVYRRPSINKTKDDTRKTRGTW
jgi:stage V sporulation protein AF